MSLVLSFLPHYPTGNVLLYLQFLKLRAAERALKSCGMYDLPTAQIMVPTAVRSQCCTLPSDIVVIIIIIIIISSRIVASWYRILSVRPWQQL